jgi:hypothetical protein
MRSYWDQRGLGKGQQMCPTGRYREGHSRQGTAPAKVTCTWGLRNGRVIMARTEEVGEAGGMDQEEPICAARKADRAGGQSSQALWYFPKPLQQVLQPKRLETTPGSFLCGSGGQKY